MAEEGSIGILTRGKLTRVGLFSLTPLTLFSSLSLSLSLSHSLSRSLSQELIYLFYTLTLFTLVINSIELIWTSPFQKHFSLIHSAQVMSHISHSLSHSLVIELMCHMTWAFFLSLFRSHHERANYHITSSE